MGNTSVRTHGIVGKAWIAGNNIYNITDVDSTNLTVDAEEKSFTFYSQEEFDKFIRSLKPVITSPSVAPAAKPAPAISSKPPAASKNLVPVPKVEETKLELVPATVEEPEHPSGMSLTAPNVNSADPLAYMKGVLIETMEKLRKDKNYVAQAKGITTAAASFTNLVALEMKIRKA